MIRRIVSLMVVCAFSASASAATLSSTLFRIDVSSSLGTGSWQVNVPNPDISDGTFNWDLDHDVQIMDATGANLLATLNMDGTSMNIVADPVLGLNFNVTAGGAPASFTISSPLLSFPGINNPDAKASAGITVTDLNGDGSFVDGNTFAGGLKSFRADYNGFVPGGTLFSNLVDDTSDPAPFSTSANTEAFPAVGFSTIPGFVTSMSTQFKFDLGTGDNAAGTSVFVVVPEPSTVLLLAGGIMGIFARRRR